MRILVISNLYPPGGLGGYEQECAVIVEHLRSRHEVLVLTSRYRRDRIPDESTVRRTLPIRERHGIDSLRAPLWALSGVREVRRAMAGFNPDLVFVWNGARLPQAALRVAAAAGVPTAFRVCEHWFEDLYSADPFMRHLYPGERGLRGAWARLARLANRHPALRLDVTRPEPATISWVTDFMRRSMERPPLVRPLLEQTVHWGILQPPARRHPDGRPTLAFVGRLSPSKGADLAVSALALLRTRHGIDARLLVTGPDDEGHGAQLRELAEGLGVSGQVEFLGALEPREVQAVYARSHVLLIPSRWQEPAGLVAIEAAAAELPVVAARSGALPELLREGSEALFFDIGDAEGCARAVAQALEDGQATRTRVERAHERAQLFSLERYFEATDRFLADTMTAYARDWASVPDSAATE